MESQPIACNDIETETDTEAQQQARVSNAGAQKDERPIVTPSKNDPLRDQPITYIDPFDPVSEDDWEALS